MLVRGPLSGLRVLDLSRILAGPYATMMLGDMGADVIKVERPSSGDDTRSWGPPFTKAGHESAYFLSVNRNKKSIAIDLKKPTGVDLIKSLASKSDIVIDNFAPGDAEKLGLSRAKFLHDFPSLIWCSITGYGQDGPLSHRLGYAVLLEAHSGLMNCTGPREGDPVKAGVAMTDILTGLHACSGILAAVYKRTMLGRGSLVDCSLLESQVSAMTNVASNWLIGNQEAQRLGTDHPSIVPYGTVKTRDGRIAIAAGTDNQFLGLCRCLGITYSEKFKTNADRVRNRDACIAEIEAVTCTRSTEEWMDIFEKVDEGRFAFAPVNNMQQVFSDPQVLHRNMVLECQHKTAGEIRLPGYPIKFPGHDFACTPPPVLGEHTYQVLNQVLDMDDRSIKNLIDMEVVYSNVVL